MHSRKFAFALAKQYRTCPPAAVRGDPAQEERLKQHRAVCPYCAETKAEEVAPWEELAKGLHTVLVQEPPKPYPERPAPGEIRLIRPERGRWRGRYYYNPPAILVLETFPAPPGALLAAQTYHDQALAGPGDLWLEQARTSYVSLFVEAWNTYTLKADDLGAVIGQVSARIVAAVKRLEHAPDAYPPWAEHPRPFDPQDVRLYFRELEVEAGYTFASTAAEELVTDMEKAGTPALIYSSAEEARRALKRVLADVWWPIAPETPEEAFALAHPPPEALPLAAAPETPGRFPVNLLVMEKGEVSAFKPIAAEIMLDIKTAGGREISGEIRGVPTLRESAFLAYLEMPGGRPHKPVQWFWDEESGFFFVRFEGEEAWKGRPAFALICELSEGDDA